MDINVPSGLCGNVNSNNCVGVTIEENEITPFTLLPSKWSGVELVVLQNRLSGLVPS